MFTPPAHSLSNTETWPPIARRLDRLGSHYVVDGEVGTEIGDVGLLDSLPLDRVGVDARYSL